MSAGFRTFNPIKNDWNPEVYQNTTQDEYNHKLSLIAEAQRFLGRQTPEKRAELLQVIAACLSQKKELIKGFYLAESGLSETRFETEWNRTIHTISHFATHLTTDFQAVKTECFPSESLQIQKHKLPIGPVLVLGSSNFPLAYSTAGGDTVSAIAAGCCVIVKAHPMHVGTSIAVANCIIEAIKKMNFPLGIFTHLIDEGYQLAQALCIDDRIKAIGFTGSINGGKALMDIAQSRSNPIPVFAEMGSLNPVLIHTDLSKEMETEFAQKLALSITNDAGQFCTKPGVIFVRTLNSGNHFVQELKNALSLIKPVPMLHPQIHRNFEERKKEVLSIPGVQSFSCAIAAKGIEGTWCLAETTLQDFASNSSLQEEVFGPFALLVYYQDVATLNQVLESLPGQLTGSVFFREHDSQIDEWTELLCTKVGRIILNGVPTGVRVVETMHHGGPFPASSDVRFTAVGQDSINRFQKDVSIQSQNIT